MSSPETAVLFTTHKNQPQIEAEFRRIKKRLSTDYALKMLFQGYPTKTQSLDPQEIFYATDTEIKELGYRTLTENLIPGHAHFPLILFYKAYPTFKYYWVVEYDVKFTGDWKILLDTCGQSSCDFLSTGIVHYKDDPDWRFWNKMELKDAFEKKDPVRSFNPIFRISNRALQAVIESQEQGSLGHNEAFLPTVVSNAGFSIGQIPQKFFSSICDGCGIHPFETHRPGPEILIPWRRNKIYHPIKAKSGRWFAILMKLTKEIAKKARHIAGEPNISPNSIQSDQNRKANRIAKL